MKKSIIADVTFKSLDELKNYTRELLSSVGFCDSVKSKNINAYIFLLELSQRHPQYTLNDNVDFRIVPNPYNSKLFQLEIVYGDKTEVISWISCCRGYGYKHKCQIKFVTE